MKYEDKISRHAASFSIGMVSAAHLLCGVESVDQRPKWLRVEQAFRQVRAKSRHRLPLPASAYLRIAMIWLSE
jgi:hypothetical protein